VSSAHGLVQATWRGEQVAIAQHRVLLEGGGAVGVAAVLSGKVRVEGATVIVLSGGNVDLERFSQVLRG